MNYEQVSNLTPREEDLATITIAPNAIQWEDPTPSLCYSRLTWVVTDPRETAAETAKSAHIVQTALFMPRIIDIKRPNDRVVICKFENGSTQKAVCHEDDTFSVEIGITICVMKELSSRCGTNYHSYIKRASNIIKEKEKKKQEEANREVIRLRQIAKAKTRKEKYLARKKQEAIDKEVAVQVEVAKRLMSMGVMGYTDSYAEG